MRAYEAEEALAYLNLTCKECGTVERTNIKGGAAQIAAKLCLGCYRKAYSKARRERAVKCKGHCGEVFPQSLLNEEGKCGACEESLNRGCDSRFQIALPSHELAGEWRVTLSANCHRTV
jgi:hypothetical protein